MIGTTIATSDAHKKRIRQFIFFLIRSCTIFCIDLLFL
jgi:hypothetical protein